MLPALIQQKVISTISANDNKQEHTTKAPRDQPPTAPPATQ